VPALSWIAWSAVPVAALWLLRSKRGGVVVAARKLALLLPAVLLLTLPVVLFAAAENGLLVGGALLARALATATAGLATVTYLGPAPLLDGLRALRLPARFVDVVHAMLVSLSAILRQASDMLRARAARGTGHAPWEGLVSSPAETVRGFGRITSALLLRSLERAEALERARRARGVGPW
jgi:energy-coupling factor transporter transmembrane protein EcfT